MANSSLPIFRLFPTSVSTCLRFTMRERWIRMKSLSGSLRLTDARLKEISLYPLDFIHCRFEIVVLPPDKDILRR